MKHESRQLNTLTVLAIGVLLVAYASVLAGILRVWSTNYLYSYGFAVPLISGYMLWTRAETLRRTPRRPDYRVGFLLTATGLALLLVGHIGAIDSIAGVSFIVTACGVTLLLFGRDWFRITWFPIVYLIVGIPIWDRLIAQLQVPSQQLSAAIAVRLLHVARVPAIQDHTFIVLPNATLEVLRECSGVNQLVSVWTMALAASFLWLKRYSRRIALVAISVTIAYLTNGVRIALVGFLSYHQLSNGRIGLLHLAEGLVVSLIGYAVIFACLSLLTRTESRADASDHPPSQPVRSFDVRRSPSLDFAIVALLAVAAVVGSTFQVPAVRLNRDLRALPSHIAGWAADSTSDWSSGFRVPGADNELVRAYRHSSGSTLRLYVGYHQYQTQGKELVDGRSAAVTGIVSTIRLPAASRTIELNQWMPPTSRARTGMLFWYDVNGRILTNLYQAKAYTIWDAVTRRRTNAAIVAIEWEARSGDDFARAQEDALRFADAVVPVLRDFLPSLDTKQSDVAANVSVGVTP